MFLSATLLAIVPIAVVETVLTRLAPLFLAGAGGDTTAARQAAAQMLDAYNPQTMDELRLAANIVGFSFQALEALGQAAEPEMPITRIFRLRSGAVSLSREAAKAERRLLQLQKAREQPILAPQAEIDPEPADPAAKIDDAIAPVQDTGHRTTAGKLTWAEAYEQRQRDMRIAGSLRKAEARIAALANAAIESPPDRHATA